MSARLHPTQEELREAHGTPEQFAEAVWNACNDLFVTTDEAVAAIQGYNDLYQLAGARL